MSGFFPLFRSRITPLLKFSQLIPRRSLARLRTIPNYRRLQQLEQRISALQQSPTLPAAPTVQVVDLMGPLATLSKARHALKKNGNNSKNMLILTTLGILVGLELLQLTDSVLHETPAKYKRISQTFRHFQHMLYALLDKIPAKIQEDKIFQIYIQHIAELETRLSDLHVNETETECIERIHSLLEKKLSSALKNIPSSLKSNLNLEQFLKNPLELLNIPWDFQNKNELVAYHHIFDLYFQYGLVRLIATVATLEESPPLLEMLQSFERLAYDIGLICAIENPTKQLLIDCEQVIQINLTELQKADDFVKDCEVNQIDQAERMRQFEEMAGTLGVSSERLYTLTQAIQRAIKTHRTPPDEATRLVEQTRFLVMYSEMGKLAAQTKQLDKKVTHLLLPESEATPATAAPKP